MSGFVVLSASPDAGLPAWADALAARPPVGWSAEAVSSHWMLLRRGRPTCGVVRLAPDAVVLGRLARSPPQPVLDALPQLSDLEAARALQRQGWGGYVYLRRTPASGRLAVYRDPGGELDAFAWTAGAVSICASEAPPWLVLPDDVSLDWGAIAAFAVNPTLQTAGCGLRGVHAVAPGELWSDGRARQLWRPADHIAAPKPRRRAAPAVLAEVVRNAVARSSDGEVLLEVSGGLDSAVVAACLPKGRLAAALNYYVRDPQGDERAFAREVADQAGVDLTEVKKPELALDLDALAAASGGLRPALNGFDHAHDADAAARCEALGVDVLMTGQGGDDVFFQSPTPLIVADGLRHGLPLAELCGLARWQNRSIYGLLAVGVRMALRGPELTIRRPEHVTDQAWSVYLSSSPHPWMTGLEAAAPGKVMQVAGLANALIVKGASRRGAAAHLRHPLLSQPVMEHVLGVSTPDLTRGRDRGLARLAFAGVVPSSILQRPTKGRMSAHYGRVLAAALPQLRSLLLQGRLAEMGILRPEVLDPMLTAETLIWRAGYGAIINATMVELWVRAWEDRLGVRPTAHDAGQ